MATWRGRGLHLVLVGALAACASDPAPPHTPAPVPTARHAYLVETCPGAVLAEPGVGLASSARVRNDLDQPVLVTMDRCVGHVRVLLLGPGQERAVSLPRPSVRYADGYRFHVYTRSEEWVGTVVTPLRGAQPQVVIQDGEMATEPPSSLGTVDLDQFEALLEAFEEEAPRVEGVDVASWEIGTGDPPVVVLHDGPLLSHGYLRPEWDALGLARRTIFYDQRGCGAGSLDQSVGWREHVADLRALVEAKAPDGVVLAGVGWGSSLALLFALHHPEKVRGLVLTDVQQWRPEGPGDAPAHLTARLDSLEAGQAVGEWPEPRRVGDGPAPSAMESEAAVRARWQRCESDWEARTPPTPYPSVRELARLSTPLLIVEGDRANGRTLSRLLPHAERVVVEVAGRHAWAAQPVVFFREVERFLREIDGR